VQRCRVAGCFLRPRSVKHGYSGGREMPRRREYASWVAMKARCANPRAQNYVHYGGRGITVCARWRDSFEAFLEDLGERPGGTTLDRIDPDGHYEPGNVRWATWKEQRQNRRPRKIATTGHAGPAGGHDLAPPRAGIPPGSRNGGGGAP
jgi:hypothetical protein